MTFDGANKLIVLSPGTVSLNVPELYSLWKQWVQQADNSKYLPAFTSIGGDPIDAAQGTAIPYYDFLINGWRVKPQAAHHTLNVTGGILLVEGGGDPFVNPDGNFVVRINYQQPVQAITVSTSGSSDPSAIAAAVWSHGSATALLTKIEFARAILQNKMITDPVTGIMTVYADDGVTPLASAQLFEDAAGTQLYRGRGSERREKVT